MTHLRKENLAVVTRRVAEDVWIQTLDGNKTRATSWCTSCRENKPLNSFYLKPQKDRKHSSDVRDYCITCFDVQNEEARLKREGRAVEKSLSSLFEFLV